jgi:hypothetical protein
MINRRMAGNGFFSPVNPAVEACRSETYLIKEGKRNKQIRGVATSGRFCVGQETRMAPDALQGAVCSDDSPVTPCCVARDRRGPVPRGVHGRCDLVFLGGLE